ncbi:hypothetical protein GCK72_019852 [Caenorhabditis remanei]|uniref:Uncharacterized protein n=1 Tax=Caenorhabditis remanei TaxID=31234 RepID=A0A6A5GF19_CAERE|nr:hypothetical protein GCK72_019852 [Caenorhabditis remanei]KAF1753296.1 hypothetical protein GCK72_019852 [Caenorhabditis remanei]
MLNTTCQYEEPFYILPLNWISSFLSIPVYGIAFIVLLMKCPKHFDEYRKYIVIHIISGLLSDFHIRVIWKVSVFLPWPSLCSNGFAVEYALIMFYIFVILLFFTGATVLNLFLQRMSAITKHVENVNFQKFIYFLRYLFYASSGVAIILVVSIYPEFRNQKETKTIIEQKFGTLPGYMWCDNCFFMQFESRLFSLFFILGYFIIICVVTAALLAAFETLRALNSNSLSLSPKTTAIQ